MPITGLECVLLPCYISVYSESTLSISGCGFEYRCSHLTSLGFLNHGLGKIVEKCQTKQKTEANSVPSKTTKMEFFAKITDFIY